MISMNTALIISGEQEIFKVQPHSFHIPVMGTGFTIDTPLKVARYGISSVMSVDDNLMEKMREYYSGLYHEPFTGIAKNTTDSRALRITAYLNFVNHIVKKQIDELRSSPFEEGAEITKYFELLDEESSLKRQYNAMMSLEGEEKIRLQSYLRESVTAGSIDVNILTKLDREGFKNGKKLPRKYSDALAAFRGFANSDLSSAMASALVLANRTLQTPLSVDATRHDPNCVRKVEYEIMRSILLA